LFLFFCSVMIRLSLLFVIDVV